MENDKIFLRMAIEIASKNIDLGGGPFGAVITKDGKLLSEGYNSVILSNDPTAHAEILAIRAAASVLGTHDLNECTLYTSCEPCPMCLGAVYWSGIKKVVYASNRSDAEAAGFNDNLIYEEIVLDPSERKIEFDRIIDTDAIEVFRKWNRLENKIPY
jgi:tRNA(Arg) A34 adenosine deaminase TadA